MNADASRPRRPVTPEPPNDALLPPSGVMGRPFVGPTLKLKCPPWIRDQLEALRLERERERLADAAARGIHSAKATRGVTMADVTRDVLRLGLVEMKRRGARAPGFAPGRALLEARRRGEPT